MELYISMFMWILAKVKVAKDGRHYVNDPDTNKAIFLKKGIVFDTHGTTDLANQTPDEKESIMNGTHIYNYLYRVIVEYVDAKGQLRRKSIEQRVVSTTIPQRFLADYTRSLETNAPSGDIYALKLGAYYFPFLNHILKGRNWTLMSVGMDALAIKPGMIEEKLGRSTFAFANASQAYFLKVDGAETHGLEQFGVSTKHAKKLSKRLQEVTRLSKTGLVTDDWNLLVDGYSGLDPMDTDGKIWISQSFAARIYETIPNKQDRDNNVRECLNGHKHEVIFRAVTDRGLIKGNAIIQSDAKLFRGGKQYDIICDTEAVKGELSFTEGGPHKGLMLVTAWDYENLHVAAWDAQSQVNFPQVLSHSKQLNDLLHLMSTVRQSINAGEIPEFLHLGEDAHNEDGVPVMEQLSELFHLSHVRWQAHGLDIRLAQNLLYMALNGVVKRMEGDTNNSRNGFLKKTWLPMTNAAAMSVVTWENISVMGGANIKTQNGDKCFYHKHYGLVMPSERFRLTYALHDGWDQDDVLRILKVKVYSSKKSMTTLCKEHGSVPFDSDIPDKKSAARMMVFTWRTPNASGGWAIEEFDFSTWPKELAELETDDVQTINLADLPLPLTAQLEKVAVGVLPSSTEYTKTALTMEQSRNMIEAQLSNPGVGRFVNPLIAWASATEGKSYFPIMPCILNDAVDSMQQGYDMAEFSAIGSGVMSMISQIIEHQVPVDRSVGMTRFSDDVWAQFNLVEGPQTKFQLAYRQAIKTLKSELRDRSLQMRNEQDVAVLIKSDPTITINGQLFIAKWTKVLRQIDGAFERDMQWANNVFLKASAQHQRINATKKAIADMMDEVNSWGDKKHARVLSIWKYILTPVKGMPLAHVDRLIFQPAAKGQQNLMDVLIEALIMKGLASKPV